ncbi:hypothetical protein LT330_008674 [Penicillium expansum]|nr:hypothetical protein LT330_008674 [Penicillium expansum]
MSPLSCRTPIASATGTPFKYTRLQTYQDSVVAYPTHRRIPPGFVPRSSIPNTQQPKSSAMILTPCNTKYLISPPSDKGKPKARVTW